MAYPERTYTTVHLPGRTDEQARRAIDQLSDEIDVLRSAPPTQQTLAAIHERRLARNRMIEHLHGGPGVATKTIDMGDGTKLNVIPVPRCDEAIPLYSDPSLMSEVHPGAKPWLKMDSIGGRRSRSADGIRYRLGIRPGPYDPRFRDQLRHGFRIRPDVSTIPERPTP